MTKYDEIGERLMSIASRKRDTKQMEAQMLMRHYKGFLD